MELRIAQQGEMNLWHWLGHVTIRILIITPTQYRPSPYLRRFVQEWNLYTAIFV